jgi:hypothetical protein
MRKQKSIEDRLSEGIEGEGDVCWNWMMVTCFQMPTNC